MCKDPWAERRWGCCTESLFGGWFSRQRPYSWDGPLAGREGLNRGDGRLPERFAGPNIGTTDELKPTTQLTHTISPSTLFPLRLEFHNISITFLSHNWECSSDSLKEPVDLFFILSMERLLYCTSTFSCTRSVAWGPNAVYRKKETLEHFRHICFQSPKVENDREGLKSYHELEEFSL